MQHLSHKSMPERMFDCYLHHLCSMISPSVFRVHWKCRYKIEADLDKKMPETSFQPHRPRFFHWIRKAITFIICWRFSSSSLIQAPPKPSNLCDQLSRTQEVTQQNLATRCFGSSKLPKSHRSGRHAWGMFQSQEVLS